MNKVTLVGRLTRDPEVRYGGADNSTAVARFTLAVDRRFKRDNEATADFIPCVVFGKSAEFAEKYFRQGMRVAISGRIQTRNYTNKDGVKVYTTEVVIEEQEFAESRSESQNNGGRSNAGQPAQQQNNNQSQNQQQSAYPGPGDGFMDIPDGIDEELPFN